MNKDFSRFLVTVVHWFSKELHDDPYMLEAYKSHRLSGDLVKRFYTLLDTVQSSPGLWKDEFHDDRMDWDDKALLQGFKEEIEWVLEDLEQIMKNPCEYYFLEFDWG